MLKRKEETPKGCPKILGVGGIGFTKEVPMSSFALDPETK